MQMRVGLLQMADCGPRTEDLLAKGEAYCRQAKALGADIVLLPELWYVSDHHFVERSWSHDYELWRGKHLWVSIAAKNSPKVPLQKSPGVGNFTLALLSASRKFPRTCVR
jgi:hypothetical protein